MLRRASACITGLLMLHFVTAKADLTCPMHQLRHGQHTMPMSDMGSPRVPTGPGHAPLGGHHGPCNEPGLPPCCQGMCSCVVAAPALVMRTTERAAIPQAPARAVAIAPSLGARAPEPPPPKA